MANFYVYLASCANGTLYTGYTTDVARRLGMHNAGRGGRFTRINRPLTLITIWPYESRTEAIRVERAIKRLSHEAKLELAYRQAYPKVD